MRRWFLALLTLLVAAQMSWAGAALCCVDELAGSSPARGVPVITEQAHAPAAGAAHPACELAHCHCHHAGCATPLADTPLPSRPTLPGPDAQAAARLKSHIPDGLERPNWPRA